MGENTKVIVYATYREIFLNPEQIFEFLKNKIKQFDPVEQISYCSFLNMICHTCYIDELMHLEYGEFRALPTIRSIISNKELIFHRETLLFYMSQVIENNINGNTKITGHSDFYRPEYIDFGRCLLLSNTAINDLKQDFFEREFIKYVPYNLPNTIYWYYYHRIIRYSFIYSELLENLNKSKKDKIELGIATLEGKYNIKLSDLFSAAKKCFMWFIGLQENFHMWNITPNSDIPMFKYKKLESFYIQRNNFKDLETFLRVIDLFSKDFAGFKDRFALESNQRDIIDNDVFKYIRCFYDYPVFKCSGDVYCIIDFKFFIEKVCRGLTWLMKNALKENTISNNSLARRIDEQNGYLIELYLSELMQKMFGSNVSITSDIPNSPDAIIETINNGVKTFVIIEFTTKQYRIASLYNRSAKCFFEDVDRLLFKNDKRDMGKFINLDKYTTNIQKETDNENIEIIPLLITESPIGDYDLINRNQGFLDRRLKENGLESMLRWKPIIINLEDIEFFWGTHKQDTIVHEFIQKLLEWRYKIDKGQYWYYFGNYANQNKTIINDNYLKIFNHAKLSNVN